MQCQKVTLQGCSQLRLALVPKIPLACPLGVPAPPTLHTLLPPNTLCLRELQSSAKRLPCRPVPSSVLPCCGTFPFSSIVCCLGNRIQGTGICFLTAWTLADVANGGGGFDDDSCDGILYYCEQTSLLLVWGHVFSTLPGNVF